MAKTYDTYKDSGVAWIGEIPSGWKVGLVGRYFDEIKNPNTNQEETNTLQFKMGNIISKKDGDSKYNPETIEAYNIVEPGTIMINGLNLSFDLISQRVAQVHEKGVITSTYLALKPTEGMKSDYAKYLLKAYDNNKALHAMGRGLRATLSYGIFRSEPVLVPSDNEQQSIATFLDQKCSEIDSLISLQEEMISELQAYKQSVITEAVTKGLDPNAKMKDGGVEWIGEIPEGWKIVKINRIFWFIGGFAFNSDKYAKDTTPHQVVRIGNVKNDFLKLDASPVYIDKEVAHQAEKYKLQKDCILFTMTGTKGKRDYFYTLLLKDEHFKEKELYLNQRVGCFYPFNNLIDVRYYNYLLKDKHILDSIFLYETGTANQGNLSIESINKTLLQFPPLSEQQAIASYLDTKTQQIDSLISLKQQKIAELKDYKKSIIYEYVTGKKRV